MIGHVLVSFLLLWIIIQKCKVNHLCPSADSQNLYTVYMCVCVCVYLPNSLFSPNIMIIITGTMRNTWNALTAYEIIIFLTGWFVYYGAYERPESLYCKLQNAFRGFNFQHRDMKFSDINSTPHWLRMFIMKNAAKLSKWR